MKRLFRMIYLKISIKALKADLQSVIFEAETAQLRGDKVRAQDLKGMALIMRQSLFDKRAELYVLENMKRGA